MNHGLRPAVYPAIDAGPGTPLGIACWIVFGFINHPAHTISVCTKENGPACDDAQAFFQGGEW